MIHGLRGVWLGTKGAKKLEGVVTDSFPALALKSSRVPVCGTPHRFVRAEYCEMPRIRESDARPGFWFQQRKEKEDARW